MSANEFDELIRRKFDADEIAYNPGNWTKMSEQLNNVPPRKNTVLATWPALAGIAAAIALLIALPALWLYNDNETKRSNPIVLEESQTPQNKPATQQIALNETQTTQDDAPPAEVNKNTPAYSSNKKTNKAPLQAQNTITADNAPVNDKGSADTHTQPLAKENIALDKAPKNPYVRNAEEIMPLDKKETYTSINLVGGFNYNNASAGYMIGASANRKLNDKLYIEGNIAYVNSNIGNGGSRSDLLAFEDGFDAVPNVTGSQSKQPQNAIQYNLSYLQFSPVLGYHVSDRFTIGAGPDLQQLLNNHSLFTLEVPALDMGILGKAEYGITEKLKAGLQYRAGINNAIHGETKYLERNYMQVQLRYAIFNK